MLILGYAPRPKKRSYGDIKQTAQVLLAAGGAGLSLSGLLWPAQLQLRCPDPLPTACIAAC